MLLFTNQVRSHHGYTCTYTKQMTLEKRDIAADAKCVGKAYLVKFVYLY